MDALEFLRFNENLLFGKIPSEYGLLWKLKEINVATSGMGGFLPSELSLLTGLERLELGYNKFRGILATELGLLTNLCKYNCNSNSSTSMGIFPWWCLGDEIQDYDLLSYKLFVCLTYVTWISFYFIFVLQITLA